MRPPDRLQHRHPPRERLLRRGRAEGCRGGEDRRHRRRISAEHLPKEGKPDGTKKIPARQCIGCMTSRPKKELVRVVRAPSGEISIDPVGKKPGRGAYLCPDAACLAKAKKKKALERCFEQPVPAEVYDALAQQLAGVEVEKEADRDGKEA
ncbi:MAG: YlxR family protein [Sutterella seckii]